MKPPIALVVSVGSGRYPPEKIGKVDAQAFLYFGKRWLQIDKLVKRTQNLLTLLNQAVSKALIFCLYQPMILISTLSITFVACGN